MPYASEAFWILSFRVGVPGLGSRVYGLGLGFVPSCGFTVWGLGFRGQGSVSGFAIWGVDLKASRDLGSGVRISGGGVEVRGSYHLPG
jgi:hypothetical protein